MPNEAEQAIYTRLQSAPLFHPSGASLFAPDWTLEPGDVVTVQSDDDNYSVPIYSLDLRWNGASMVDIQSTGNQKREPLSALKRKEYSTRRFGYGLSKALEEETQQQYEHYVDQTNAYRKEIYRVNGVVYDSAGNIVYQTDPVTGEYILDNAGNKIPVYNPESNGSISGQVIQSAQRMATIITQSGTVTDVFDETRQYYEGDRVLYPDANGSPYRFINDHNPGAWKGTGEHGDVEALGTLQSQIDQNVANTSSIYGTVVDLGNGLARIEGSTIWQNETAIANILGTVEIDSMTGNFVIKDGKGLYVTGDSVINGFVKDNELDSGFLIQRINGNTEATIKADKINTEGIVTAMWLDARLINVDNLFSQAGYSGSISVGTTVTAGSVVADNYYFRDSPSNEQIHTRPIQLLGGERNYLSDISALAIGTATTMNLRHYHDIDIEEVTTGANAGKMKVTIGEAVATSDTGNHIDYFKIADTTAYRNGVASAEATGYESGWGAAYGEVVLPTTTQTENAYMDISVPSSIVDGDAIHQRYTVSVDDDYAYIKTGTTTVARVENTGGGSSGFDEGYAAGQENSNAVINSISHPAGDISYAASYLNVDIYSNPSLVLTSQQGIVSYIEKTGLTDTVQIPVTVTPASLVKGNITKPNNYTGTYTISGDDGNVNIDGQNGADIPVGVTGLPITLELGVPSTDLGTTGAAKWSAENHNYVYNVSSSLTVDSTGNVLTRASENITLNPVDAIEYGQSTVSALLSSASAPSGSTVHTLSTGVYGLFLTKNSTPETNPVLYYRVTTGGSVNYVISSSGDRVLVWDGLTLVGGIYPNTDVTLGGTDQLGRRQISYNGKSGYVSASNISTSKGTTNFPGRIGWVGDESDPSTRSVYSLSDVVLSSSDTTTSRHYVDVTYDNGTVVQGGAVVTVDASAISGGGGGEGGISSASIYAHSDESSDWDDWTKNSYGALDEKYGLVKVNAKDGTSYYFGVNASDVWQNGYTLGRSEASPYNIEEERTYTVTSNGTRTISPSSSSFDAMATVRLSVNVSSQGGVSGVSKYAESEESTDWNDWVFDSTETLAQKYGNFTITGNDGSTYKFGVNASSMLESNRTVTYTTNGRKTLYPSSRAGMEKATITINVPQSTASLGTRTFTSNGSYSASSYGYDGFSSVTVNVSSTATKPTITVGGAISGSAPNPSKTINLAKGRTYYVNIGARSGNQTSSFQLEMVVGS